MKNRKYNSVTAIAIIEAICLFATKSSYIAVAWWILSDSSPLSFAITIATSELAESFFMPILSPIIDRYKSISIVKCSIAINFFVSLTLAMNYDREFRLAIMLILILLSVMLIALSSAARNLGMQKYIASMNPNFVTHCVAIRTSIRSVMTIIGPAMGGVLTWFGGIRSIFFLESILCLFAIMFIKYSWSAKKDEIMCGQYGGRSSYMRELFDGFFAIVRIKTEFGIGILSAGINFAIAPFFQ